MSYILNLDDLILGFIQSNMRNPFLDTLMPMITFLGDKGLLWLTIAFCLIGIAKYRPYGIVLVLTLLVVAFIDEIVLKNIFERIRPCYASPISAMLITPPTSFSFPSGHTASSFACAFVLWKWNKSLGSIAYILASLIAFSRLYLFVHYPTDILGGIFVGTTVAIAVYHFSTQKLNLELTHGT